MTMPSPSACRLSGCPGAWADVVVLGGSSPFSVAGVVTTGISTRGGRKRTPKKGPTVIRMPTKASRSAESRGLSVTAPL